MARPQTSRKRSSSRIQKPERPKVEPTPSPPKADQEELRKIAQDAAPKLWTAYERVGRECPPPEVVVERLVEAFNGLVTRVLTPKQGVRRDITPKQGVRRDKKRFDVATLGLIARRFFLDGTAVHLHKISGRPCHGRFHGPSKTLKVWVDGRGPTPQPKTMKRLDHGTGKALLAAIRSASAAKLRFRSPAKSVADLMSRVRQYERSGETGAGSWLALDATGASLTITSDVQNATKVASLPVEKLRAALYVFNRHVDWCWSIVTGKQVGGRTVLVVSDGERWIASFASPAGAAPTIATPPAAARAPWEPKEPKSAEGPAAIPLVREPRKSTLSGSASGGRATAEEDDPLKFLDDIKEEEPTPSVES